MLSGENGDGEKLADPNNLVGLTKSANQAFKYPSVHSYLYAMNQLKEGERYGRSPISVWDTPINQRRILTDIINSYPIDTGGWHEPEPTYEEYLEMERQGRWPRDKKAPEPPRGKYGLPGPLYNTPIQSTLPGGHI